MVDEHRRQPELPNRNGWTSFFDRTLRQHHDSCIASHNYYGSLTDFLSLKGSELLGDVVTRFLLGGLFVSAFALIGDLFKPKRFAGLFGAAPSVALATLSLTLHKDGKEYAALEARSMLFGAAALFVYCCVVTFLLKRDHLRALAATTSAAFVWFVTAFGLWYVFGR